MALDLAKVRRSLDGNLDWAVKLLCDLISVPTVVPPGEKYEELVSLARDVLRELGLGVEVHRVPKEVVAKKLPGMEEYPRLILLARLGSGRPILHFNGHYDVVPPGSGWRRNPFKPVVEGGRVYGRGASDMKGGIACFIYAVKSLLDAGWQPEHGSIELSLTPDEEVGGATGVGYMLEAGLSKPDYVVVAEPTGPARVWIGNKGNVWLRVRVYGKQAHASTPWLGRNAFEDAAYIAYKLSTSYREMISTRLSKLPYEDPREARPTLTLGGEVAGGGGKINVIPGYFEFTVDRRTIPEEDPRQVEAELRGFIEAVAQEIGARVDVVTVAVGEAAYTSPDSELVRAVVEEAEKVLGRKPKTVVCAGGLDTRYYQARGIQAVTYGPGSPEQAHVPDESIEVAAIREVGEVYARLMLRLLGS